MAPTPNMSTSGRPLTRFAEFYEQTCNRIRTNGTTDEIMSHFMKVKNDWDRVKYVATLDCVPALSIEPAESKNMKESKNLEEEYDRLILNEENASTARKIISKSIQTTPTNEETLLAIRFMKRSWSSLLQQQFDHALTDALRCTASNLSSSVIWNAYEILGHCYAQRKQNKKAELHFKQAVEGLRMSDCSNETKAKATLRVSIVLKSIKGQKDGKQKQTNIRKNVKDRKIPQVSLGQHSILESASKAVELTETLDAGRGLFATKKIRPGDVIIAEEPFVAVEDNECLDTNCYNCYERLETPLPCPTCSLVWFCDSECLDEGKKGLHPQECKLLSLFFDPCMGIMALLVFRILQKATWQKLRALREELNPKSEDQEVKRDFSNFEKYSTHDYLTTFQLVTNDTQRSFGDLLKRSLTAIFIERCLETVNFFDDFVTDEDKHYVAGLALRHLQGSSCNAYAICEYVLRKGSSIESVDGREVGGAIYPTISLTNHSCCPNTFRYNVGKACVLRATKTIPIGAQVFDNYGPRFETMALKERQELLKSQYKFDCNCPACQYDWPLYPHKNLLTFTCPEPSCRQPTPYSDKSTQCIHCGNSDSYKSLLKKIKIHLDSFAQMRSNLSKGNIAQTFPVLLSQEEFLHKNFIVTLGKNISDLQESIKWFFLSEESLVYVNDDK